MSTAYDFGREAEQLAQEFLVKNNYVLLTTNWRYLKGEIDIVAQHNDEIIFIEVKALSYTTLKKPEEAVNIKKKKLLIKTADEYLQQNNINLNARFDIISIYKIKNSLKVNHIKNAFEVF